METYSSFIRERGKFDEFSWTFLADSDGAAIMSEILYAFSKFARFLIDFGLVFVAESPIYYQNGKYYYPSDVPVGSQFPGGDFNPSKHFKRYKGLAALDVEDAKAAFFNESTRRLIQVTPEGMDYSMKLVEDINTRKQLLYNHNILTNPYNFTDL